MMSSQHDDANRPESADTHDAAEMDTKTGEPVEEGEKNLSRHSTGDSAPPIAEQERTTVRRDED